MKKCLSCLLFCVIFLFALSAEEIDVLYLKDGTAVKGKIIEQKPGEYIRLRELSGDIVTIEVGNIDRIALEEGTDGSTAAGGRAERRPTFTVQKAYGSVDIDVKTAGTLYLNGTMQGVIPTGSTAKLSNLEIGNHSLEMRYEDGKTESKTVTVQKDRTAQVAFSYVPWPKIPEGFVLVEAGTFRMGSTDGTDGDDDEEPVHSVTISKSFYMSKNEITQKQWREVMGTNPLSMLLDRLMERLINNLKYMEDRGYINYHQGEVGLLDLYYSKETVNRGETADIADYSEVQKLFLEETGKFLAEDTVQTIIGDIDTVLSSDDVAEETKAAYRDLKQIVPQEFTATREIYNSLMDTRTELLEQVYFDYLPVENVSWYDAVEYCNRLSVKEGFASSYSGSGDSIWCDFSANGYRLPTEAEREYAARGGKSSRSYRYSGSSSVGDVGWYYDKSGR